MSRHDQESVWSDFRVGVLTFSALVVLILGIAFAGGDKGLLFQKKTYVNALLSNVGGIKKGSSVTMGGMIIGKVADIAFTNVTGSASPIEVTMQVRSNVLSRIKSDSVPTVRTQGMLGDRYVDISMGTADAPILEPGKVLIGKSATDFDETLHQALDVLSETEKLLTTINEQKGSVGQFFYDERFYQNLVQITAQLNDLIQDFKKQPRKYIKFSMF